MVVYWRNFLAVSADFGAPTVRTVLAVRLQFHLLIEHSDRIRNAKYIQDISFIDEDMESQT